MNFVNILVKLLLGKPVVQSVDLSRYTDAINISTTSGYIVQGYYLQYALHLRFSIKKC